MNCIGWLISFYFFNELSQFFGTQAPLCLVSFNESNLFAGCVL